MPHGYMNVPISEVEQFTRGSVVGPGIEIPEFILKDKRTTKIVRKYPGLKSTMIFIDNFLNDFSGPNDILLYKENQGEWLKICNTLHELERVEPDVYDEISNWVTGHFKLLRASQFGKSTTKNAASQAHTLLISTMQRAKENVWWTSSNIDDWSGKNLNLKEMVKLGDYLRFDETELSYRLEVNSKLKENLNDVFKILSASKSDAQSNELLPEVEALSAYRPEGNSNFRLYDSRRQAIIASINRDPEKRSKVDKELMEYIETPTFSELQGNHYVTPYRSDYSEAPVNYPMYLPETSGASRPNSMWRLISGYLGKDQ
ncbi:expressed protein [Phakopsora pachyrhizi]|uniref:Expressed protein n=1 Tax=Phakopsora pachyrhizi TaxID=170000 RepID=A0AAV0AJ05_PHAPC|nr:expressed protein [Phakopsora pachyrhizi]